MKKRLASGERYIGCESGSVICVQGVEVNITLYPMPPWMSAWGLEVFQPVKFRWRDSRHRWQKR